MSMSGVHKCHRLLRVPPIRLLAVKKVKPLGKDPRGTDRAPLMMNELSEGLTVPRS